MLLFILSIIAGIAFVGAGIYFLSNRFLEKINNSSPEKTEEAIRRNRFRAHGTAYTSLGLGALTLVFACMLLAFPGIEAALALVYMILLVCSFAVLIVIYK